MRSSNLEKGTLREQLCSYDLDSTHAVRGMASRCQYFFGVFAVLFASVLACSSAFATNEQVLWNFGLSDGGAPNGGLIMDASGNLLGTCFDGGSNGGGGSGDQGGTIFKLTPTGEASTLWNFGGSAGGILFGPPDGQEPAGGLIMDANGNLYGATIVGGLYDDQNTHFGGTVFKLTSAGQESVLWNFGNGADGTGPGAGLIMDASGNLFGTTEAGGAYGANPYSSGTAFELTPAGQESILWSFGNGADGVLPSSSLIMDASGNLYGVTKYGGAFGPPNPPFKGSGILFKLTPSAAPAVDGIAKTTWTESVMWNFGNGADGQNPNSSVVMDANGNLYGTTGAGGTNNAGTVFEVTSAGQESVLWNFGTGTDGQEPNGLIMDTSGNLIGTTAFGGIYNAPFICTFGSNSGCGTAFKLSPPSAPGGAWNETILWNFGNGTDGYSPSSPLLMDASGNLFGATAAGGTNFFGTVFELSNFGPSGQILLKTPRIAFPNTAVGQTSSFQLAIRNTGTGTLTGMLNPPPAPFGIQGSGSFKLAPKTQMTLTLTFNPTAATRAHQVAAITSNSAKQSSVNLDLRGIGIPAPATLALKELD